jgi:hypothetical protein
MHHVATLEGLPRLSMTPLSPGLGRQLRMSILDENMEGGGDLSPSCVPAGAGAFRLPCRFMWYVGHVLRWSPPGLPGQRGLE